MRALEVSRDVESARADVDDAMVRAIRDGTARSVDLVRRFDAPTLRASAVHRVARAVTSSRAVVTLTLAGHALALDSVRALAAALAAAPALRTLDLGDCAVDDSGAEAIARSLFLAPSVARLFLDRNALGPPACESLAASFRVGTKSRVRVLDLSNNPLGDAGAAALARGLVDGATRCDDEFDGAREGLAELALRRCDVGDAGARRLAEALRACEGIERVDLEGNRIGLEARLALVDDAEAGRERRAPRVYVGGCGGEMERAFAGAARAD